MSTIRSVLAAPKQIITRIANYPLKAGLATLALDQATKFAIRSSMALGEKHCILGDQLGITYVLNKGAAFSEPFEFTTGIKILFAATTLSMAGLFIKAKSKVAKLAISLYMAGGIGTYIDRFTQGSVTDFIKTTDFWPIWNIADAAGSFVAGGLLLSELWCKSLTESADAVSPEKITKIQILKNSFTQNIWNTAGQTFLYSLMLWSVTGYAGLVTILPALLISIVRDMRHSGQRLF